MPNIFCVLYKMYLYILWNNVLNLKIVGIRPSTICVETWDSMRNKLVQIKYKSLPTGWIKFKINLLCNLVQLFSYHFPLSWMCEVHLLVHQPPIGIWSCCILRMYFHSNLWHLRPSHSWQKLWNWNNFVFIFVIVFFLARTCLLITLIKCLKSHKSLGSLFEGAL